MENAEGGLRGYDRAMRRLLSALALALAITTPVSFAQGARTAAQDSAARYFAGLDLVDHNGRKVDLYEDVMQDHSLVIHTFYANCTGSCPMTFQTMKALQTSLGKRMEKEVRLVSITIEPAEDTPAALKGFARQLGAKPGWIFLTGSEAQVTAALKRLKLYTEQKAQHGGLLLAGNNRTGLWKKISGLADVGKVDELVLSVVNDGLAR